MNFTYSVKKLAFYVFIHIDKTHFVKNITITIKCIHAAGGNSWGFGVCWLKFLRVSKILYKN